MAVAVGKDDHWAPESMYKELRDATPSPGGALLTRFYPGLKHDFVTTDDGTGRKYYFHEETGESRWTKPPADKV